MAFRYNESATAGLRAPTITNPGSVLKDEWILNWGSFGCPLPTPDNLIGKGFASSDSNPASAFSALGCALRARRNSTASGLLRISSTRFWRRASR